MSIALAHKIEAEAKERGISPSALIVDLGFTPSNLTFWRTGKTKARKSTKMRILSKLEQEKAEEWNEEGYEFWHAFAAGFFTAVFGMLFFLTLSVLGQ